MDDAPQPYTFEQFSAAMLEAAHLHTDIQWVLVRARSGEPLNWLSGFGDAGGKHPVWVSSADEAATYDREGAELARLRCTALPDHDDVLYAVCYLKVDDDTGDHKGRSKRISDFEGGMLNAIRELNRNEDLRTEIAKRIS